jgi:hypothetical protein
MEMESLRETLQTSDFFENLTAALSSFPLEHLVNPTLVLRAFIQEGDSADGDSFGTFEANEEAHLHSGPIRLLTSVRTLSINHHSHHTGEGITYTNMSSSQRRGPYADESG